MRSVNLGKHSLCNIFYNKLTNNRHKELPGNFIAIVDYLIEACSLKMTKGTESTKEMIPDCPLITNEKAFDITDLFNNSMKYFNLPMSIMKALEFISCYLTENL